jgi:hypothetical protein
LASHPTNEEREQAALPFVRRAIAALAGSDAPALEAVLRDDAVALTASGKETGSRHAAFALLGACRDATSWEPPRQHGAHALLGFAREDGSRGGIALEVRRDGIVFAGTLG